MTTVPRIVRALGHSLYEYHVRGTFLEDVEHALNIIIPLVWYWYDINMPCPGHFTDLLSSTCNQSNHANHAIFPTSQRNMGMTTTATTAQIVRYGSCSSNLNDILAVVANRYALRPTPTPTRTSEQKKHSGAPTTLADNLAKNYSSIQVYRELLLVHQGSSTQ